MSVRIYVTKLGDPTEGGRLLWLAVKRAGSFAALGRAVGVDKSFLGRFVRGYRKPSATLRSKLRPLGIPFESWDDPPRRPFSLSARAA